MHNYNNYQFLSLFVSYGVFYHARDKTISSATLIPFARTPPSTAQALMISTQTCI